MLIVNYDYSGKEFKLQPYNTSREKDLLLLSTVGENNLENVLVICGISEDDQRSLTIDEKFAMLLRLRAMSVGEEINIKFKCKHCDQSSENTIDITNIIEGSNITNDNIVDAFKELTDDNVQEFLKADINELDIDEYDALYKEVKETVTKFNFRKTIICQNCKKENYYKINKTKFIIENMSEDTLMSIYQTYNDLIFHSSYTKLDVDLLYPFERSILISILNKTKEDFNK